MENKRFYFGFLGFLGFLGFQNTWYFLFFLFFLFFLPCVKNNCMPFLIKEQRQRKTKHLQKIMKLFEIKEKVVNDDVEKLLGVSDATVQRYFNELEAEGKVVQVGETGKGVYYKKI
jgi:predicted HTH transcriptional regulator